MYISEPSEQWVVYYSFEALIYIISLLACMSVVIFIYLKCTSRLSATHCLVQPAGSCHRNLTLLWPWASSLIIAYFLNISPSDIFTSPPRSFKLTLSDTFLLYRPVALCSYYFAHSCCVCHVTIRLHCLGCRYVVGLLYYQFTVLFA